MGDVRLQSWLSSRGVTKSTRTVCPAAPIWLRESNRLGIEEIIPSIYQFPRNAALEDKVSDCSLVRARISSPQKKCLLLSRSNRASYAFEP
jgi:hypothetical protein